MRGFTLCGAETPGGQSDISHIQSWDRAIVDLEIWAGPAPSAMAEASEGVQISTAGGRVPSVL